MRLTKMLVFDDYQNFGKRDRLSNVYIRPEYFIFGQKLIERTSFPVSFFRGIPSNSTLILGGSYSPEKVTFLKASGAFFKRIILTGGFGLEMAKWMSVYQVDVNKQATSADRVFRNLLEYFLEKELQVVFPADCVYLKEPVKEEVIDPKKKPTAKEEPAEPQGFFTYFNKDSLTEEEVKQVEANLVEVAFKTIDIDQVKAREAYLREEIERRYQQELLRVQQERERLAEESKDPKKKKVDSKQAPTLELPKRENIVIENLPGDELATSGFLTYKQGMFVVDWGPNHKQDIIEAFKDSQAVLWVEEVCFNPKWKSFERTFAKLVKDHGISQKAYESTLAGEAKEAHVGYRLGLVGARLIEQINSFDLKDIAPPRERRVREATGEDGDLEEEPEEEIEEEEDEEEDEFEDDDLSSGEVRRLRKKDNVDQMTAIYHRDTEFFLKLMGGTYFEGKYLIIENLTELTNRRE
jgi:hypothetical protein